MITPDPIDAEVSRLRAENSELMAVLKNIVSAEDDGEAALLGLGMEPVEDHSVIASARALIAKAESAPPRFFRGISGGWTWEWRNGRMTLDGNDGEESIFTSPAELLECLNVIETDENGDPLKPILQNSISEIRDWMIIYGGEFVKQLAKLTTTADSENLAKLIGAFPEIFAKYDDMVEPEETPLTPAEADEIRGEKLQQAEADES